MLRATLAWRETAKVASLTYDDVEAEAQSGKTYRLRQRDKLGRPVLLLAPGRENTKEADGQLAFLACAAPAARLRHFPWALCLHGSPALVALQPPPRPLGARYNMELAARSVSASWDAPPRGTGANLAPEQVSPLIKPSLMVELNSLTSLMSDLLNWSSYFSFH